MTKEKVGKKIKKWLIIGGVCIGAVLIQAVRTLYCHFTAGEYSAASWELVWPVIVSTMVAVFGTLMTSYVFLKDALDRTIDEKPYYARVIREYRQEKIRVLMWYSVMFVGVSCYLILYQNASGGEGSPPYDSFLYAGIVAVVVLMILSIYFLYQCVNIDEYIGKTAQTILDSLGRETAQRWKRMDSVWSVFIDNYVKLREEKKSLAAFLEIGKEAEAGNDAEAEKVFWSFDAEKFVIKFSEWEKFILAFLDKSAGFHSGQDIRQRVMIAAGYIEKMAIIQNVERDDAQDNGWYRSVYPTIQRYERYIEKNMDMDDFLEIYALLSDYRDVLQVRQDKQVREDNREFRQQSKAETENRDILYLFFLLRFYSSVRCLVTLPRVELFYPAAKLNDVDFYNVRFENCSFRASAFSGVIFARIKMVGSNLALSKFADCNFYNADMRDCALGNSVFANCLMTEMIWSDVDVTGSNFVEADLRGSAFENAVLVNVEIHKSMLSRVNFIGCKLSQIDFYEIAEGDFRYSSFENSTLHKICFHDVPTGSEIPEKYRDCNKNYFRTLSVTVNKKGMKEREKADIWNGMQGAFFLDLSSSSFVNAFAEEIHFSHMRMDAALLKGANMQKADLRNVRMHGCVMGGVNLTEASFQYVDMESCVLTEAVLYKAQLRLVNLQNSNLLGCHASESVWTCCMLDKSDMSTIDLTKSVMQYSSCRDTILKDAELTYAHFTDVVFENCNGPGLLSSYSCFENCNFGNAFFGVSNFNYTIFRGCDMALASLADSTIEEAEFSGCGLENSNFRGCCFIKVTFCNNKDVDAEIFEHCTFIKCRFEGSDKKWEKILRDNPQQYEVKFR